MSEERESFLTRVRAAVQAGNRPGSSGELKPRGQTGYQGAGADPLQRFCDEFRNAGGQPHPVRDTVSAVELILGIVRDKTAKRILLGRGPLLDPLNLASVLRQSGVEVALVDELPADAARETYFAADIGITEPTHLVAETGSIIELADASKPRSMSLLPPIHIAVAGKSHLVPDLFDFFSGLETSNGTLPSLPSCCSIITGPSKTGDIELKLVTGVHGPGEVHAVLIG
jgi:L-lactate utilization protein LutC